MKLQINKDFIKQGGIWVFIIFELAFFSIAGNFLSVSGKAFMDFDNMLLLLKQSAPIGIIALGMTIIMINGNIDLSVGAIFALSGIVLLDSMTWPFMQALGDWAIPLAWGLALLTGCGSRGDQRVDCLENRCRCIYRHACIDAGLSRAGVHVSMASSQQAI
jgi:ribose transport system permease protein